MAEPMLLTVNGVIYELVISPTTPPRPAPDQRGGLENSTLGGMLLNYCIPFQNIKVTLAGTQSKDPYRAPPPRIDTGKNIFSRIREHLVNGDESSALYEINKLSFIKLPLLKNIFTFGSEKLVAQIIKVQAFAGVVDLIPTLILEGHPVFLAPFINVPDRTKDLIFQAYLDITDYESYERLFVYKDCEFFDDAWVSTRADRYFMACCKGPKLGHLNKIMKHITKTPEKTMELLLSIKHDIPFGILVHVTKIFSLMFPTASISLLRQHLNQEVPKQDFINLDTWDSFCSITARTLKCQPLHVKTKMQHTLANINKDYKTPYYRGIGNKTYYDCDRDSVLATLREFFSQTDDVVESSIRHRTSALTEDIPFSQL